MSKTHLMRALSREQPRAVGQFHGYRAPTASKADITRAFKKLAATPPAHQRALSRISSSLTHWRITAYATART